MKFANSSTTYGARPMDAEFEHSAGRDDTLLWKCLVLLALIYLIWTDRISINLIYDASEPPQRSSPAALMSKAEVPSHSTAVEPTGPSRAKTASLTLPAHATGHTRFAIDPEFARRNGCLDGEVQQAMNLCRSYMERYAPVAQAEMRRFGIPASITLAQGLLESNAGDSPLVRKTNNHFGIKCFSKTCKRGHCTNFTDDSHKDFFVRYDNAWSSYRAHSQFLKNSKRYAALFELDPTDYRAWAQGLERAGYATDPRYAEKLIALIENLGLSRYDLPSMP